MKKITKLVCIAMALVILGCSTNGATASAAKRIYFAGMHFHFDDGNVILWSEFCDECYSTKRAGKPEKCSSSVSSTLLFCRGSLSRFT